MTSALLEQIFGWRKKERIDIFQYVPVIKQPCTNCCSNNACAMLLMNISVAKNKAFFVSCSCAAWIIIFISSVPRTCTCRKIVRMMFLRFNGVIVKNSSFIMRVYKTTWPSILHTEKYLIIYLWCSTYKWFHPHIIKNNYEQNKTSYALLYISTRSKKININK